MKIKFRQFILLMVFIISNAFGNEQTLLQKRSVIIKNGQYFPEKIILFEKETLHLMVGNLMGHSTCLSNEDLNFFINTSAGEITEKNILFQQVGNYHFNCPGQTGELIVVVQPKPILAEQSAKQVSRTPASVDPGVWIPRDNKLSDDLGGGF